MPEPVFDTHSAATPEVIAERQVLAERVSGTASRWSSYTAPDLFAQGIDYLNPPPIVSHHNTVLQHIQAALLGRKTLEHPRPVEQNSAHTSDHSTGSATAPPSSSPG